ncbi:hypothetical protein DSM14862_04156 (plasmid) [Sulfitobacter indolifex]|uniref:PRC-barrel domain-containing protein n=1 Tax=Sulfitobacter indolifex HEL-45 TaxID=391624 RepID=A0ABM9X1E5_9RHOB|nr:PRC-barrel domain-containing protein [Sulfitobacter indolifex]EDQ03259.1 hypothetical protein OIHEL45_16561 [Sulfitobacter indolifex HEL-45]UOA21316.1 hypothetical protein DSM14862_04156 [Sulfitobacter indolifex]
MQRSYDIVGYKLRAKDGTVGSITDLLFDDRHFALRWMVVDTGKWLPGRKVLLPPSALGSPDPSVREYPVDLNLDEIEAAPGLETDEPVSHQLEADIYGHYGWSPYWDSGYGYALVGGMQPVGAVVPEKTIRTDKPEATEKSQHGDPHLRSISEVTGYYVEATDGSIGHIENFVIDETEWIIRYLMIDTKNWWPGKMVLISPHWLREIDWSDRKIFVDVTRYRVKAAPGFDPSMTLDREYEERMYTHYGYQPYWAGWL